MSERFPITIDGHALMKQELNDYINKRHLISERISIAREHGDLKENAEYHAAREQLGFNEAKVAELEDKLSRAEVIDIKSMKGDTVKFGAIVTIMDDDTEKEVTYQIVGEYEANIEKKKIAITSPIARALIGKKVDETAEVHTPKGEKSYTITKISYNN